jgi:serine phosphatase RsbU (regulator of sigma subunit)
MNRSGLATQLAQERQVTLELQRAILPLPDEPFDVPGLQVAMRYLPASQDSRVGGDWYITARMPTGQVLVAIGDVAGRGAGHAMRRRARRQRSRAGHRRRAAGAETPDSEDDSCVVAVRVR